MNVFSTAHGVGQNSFHLVWKPKYAYSILVGEIKTYCEEVLKQISRDYGYVVHALEVMPDHIHMFLTFKPSASVSGVLQRLKGISARRLFERFPELRKRYWGGHLWSPGKFFRSVGSTTDWAVKHYIEYSQGDWKNPEKQIPDPQQTSITRFL